ncbi:MAG: glutamine transport system permease protein [Epulopiscium sp.]|jgi:polar amino acid transport system permease protein/polar amino acid transport system substrate-binding protein|uniref:ABC transporter permease subunit n=1 Tax=Defluviitalea raffinosedens TaxID=1450156 RepID=A0A7C8LNS8_9FIRM|nr:amino acid ABC transporter permease [Defluviitalea raffinosedens]KAE9630654.1 ABC transporter permease subunit [Defluviitalea raffinosedens]MBM7686351.1 polar amino acid transport system permease protein/polar amino acid transport system substrate-binding protein [Defluviitalea raffinosedens]MBZ4667136.1 Amino acid transporter permease [Defluviitaleaceae bacterium]MDK2789349.1 glutamine transport system permease protein [Candidatus Epulonipiscium sp.]
MIMIIEKYGYMLMQALGKTLLLTLLSLFFAMIIGLIFSLMNVGKNRVFNLIGTAYVDGVRGVPLIVLAYFIYFGVPAGVKMMGVQDFRLSALQAGTIALAMNCGAYMAEIIRAGIESVDKGQMEASRSLGLSYAKSMRLVVLPQAIRTMIPSIINQFIITLKDTSILSVIGFPELTNMGKTISGNTFKSLETWTIVGIMYMVVIVTLSKVAKRIERRINRGR